MRRKIRSGVPVCILMAAGCIFSSYLFWKKPDSTIKEVSELIKKAEYHEDNSAYITAADYYRRALDYDSRNTEIMLKAAENYLLCDDDDNFLKYCSMAEKLGCIDAYKMRIHKFIDDDDLKEAYEAISEISEKQMDEECRKLKRFLKYSYEESIMCYEDMKGFHDGVSAAELNGKWGLADSDGYIVCECVYDDAGAYCREEDIFPVRKNDEWFFADINGNRKYVPEKKYSYLGAFSDGLAPFSDGDKYGYISLDYSEKNLKYDFAGAFSQGAAAVSENGRWYLVNSDLKRITEEDFDFIQTDRNGFCSVNGVITVIKNGKTEYRNLKGNSSEKKFSGCMGLNVFSDGNMFGYEDETGETAIEPVFDEALAFSENGSACVMKNGEWFVISLVSK